MVSAVRLRTTVLPGHRIEVSSPELPDNAEVDVIVMLNENEPGDSVDGSSQYTPATELIRSQPAGPRSAATWREIEQHLQEDRDSWER